METAQASIALAARWRPGSGSVKVACSVTTVARPAGSRVTAFGRSSAPSSPAVTTRRASRRAPAARAAGSVPTTASGAPSTSESFSASTPSSDPNPSRCPAETFVTTATVGSMICR